MTDSVDDAVSSEPPKETEKPDLDSALASWTEKDGKSELAALREQVLELTQEAGQRSYEKSMTDLVIPTIKGDLEIDDDLVEFWANKQADNDPALRKLWDNRSENKAEFEKALQDLTPKFKEYAESKNMTKPDDSLAAAVANAKETTSTSPSLDEVDLSAMPEHEFQAHKQKVFAMAEAGKLT